MDSQSAIAIVGMSLRFPGADNKYQFWDNLRNGRGSVETLSTEELLARGASVADINKENYVRRVSALNRPDLFDADFFGMTSREAQLSDPQLRVLLQVCHEAIEDSGHVLNGTQTAVYVGVADNDHWLSSLIYNHPEAVGASLGNRVFIKKDYFATQISHKLNLLGPSVSVSTACSTSMVAVFEACSHLQMYHCDFALAGGCEIDQRLGYMWEEGGILSRDGTCRAFSADANGTVFGSGCGVVVLRRYEDAVRDGDHIYAVIRGCAINNDGRTKAGFTAPSVVGQEQVILETMTAAGVSAADIGLLEAHGTGTLVGDPIEVQALSKVFARFTPNKQFCALGSVKTNVGHLSVTAGVAGLIKAALALQHREIPPLLNFTEVNPEIDLKNSAFYISTKLRPWLSEGPRIAGVSAFGVGGTNSHAIVQEAPVEAGETPKRRWQVLPLSAKSTLALDEYRRQLALFLTEHPERSLSDVAFTLQTGRAEYPHRCAAVCSTDSEVALDKDSDWIVGTSRSLDNAVSAFVFPGQGSQYAGMSRDLYAQEPEFQQHVDQCARYLEPFLGLDIRELLYPTSEREARAQELLQQTQYTQPAMFVVSYAVARLLQGWGVTPTVMIGHSIGEYVAACLAGVFTLEDCLKVVATRGQLMQQADRGGMLSVTAPAETVHAMLSGRLEISVINGPNQCVVGGTLEDLEPFASTLTAAGIRSSKVLTSHAFHSWMMEGILQKFGKVFEGMDLQAPTLPFISNVTGKHVTPEQATDPNYWMRHLRSTVKFADGIQAAVELGVNVFVEVGPGTALAGLLRQQDLLAIPSMRHPKNKIDDGCFLMRALAELWVSGVKPKWNALHGEASCRRVSLPTYPYQQKSYQLDTQAKQSSRRSIPRVTVHPLLGERWSKSSTASTYENYLRPDNPGYLADHRLMDVAILPGAAYCEMALAAARAQHRDRPVRIKSIVFHQALMLDPAEAREVQTIVHQQDAQTWSFEITSTVKPSKAGADPRWLLHASGCFSLQPQPPASEELDSLRARITESYDMDSFYSRESIRYGAAFRALKQLWANGREAIGRIELPPSVSEQSREYHLHPVLLDSCFQAIGAFGGRIGKLVLPVGVTNLDVFGRVPEQVWVHMSLSETAASDVPSEARIIVYDDLGNVLAAIESYQRKEVSAEALQNAEQYEDLFFDLAWVAQDLPRAEARLPPERLIIFTDDVKHASMLAAAIGAKGDVSIQDYAKEFDAAGPFEQVLTQTQTGEAGVVEVVVMRVSEKSFSVADLCDVVLRVTKEAEKCADKINCRLALVTRGSQATPGARVRSEPQVSGGAVWGFGTSISKECPQLRCLRIDLDGATQELNSSAIADELQRRTDEDVVAYQGTTRYVARIRPAPLTDASAPEAFRVCTSEFGTFDSLRVRNLERRRPSAGEVEVELLSAGLNFKETLIALGMLHVGKTASELAFGFEGAGTISAVGPAVEDLHVGDEVIVWANGCLASHVITQSSQVLKADFSRISPDQAAALPTVFMTAQHALHRLAAIRRGDRVLIHAGAGGVGQAAIQIAIAAGAEVFATASRSKWEYLASQGIRHIYDSRSTSFAQEILDDTNGRGVDIVLNSLTGDFIKKSFDALAQNGRFIEIGKLNIWSVEQAKGYRADVDYHAFELGVAEAGGPHVVQDLLAPIWSDLESGVIQPLPIRTFDVAEMTQALRWLAAGKNIGKGVVRIAERKPSFRNRAIRADRDYLVSGGLGALGMHVAEWLVDNGARSIVLLSRRAPSLAVQGRLDRLRSMGARIVVGSCDVAVKSQLREVIDACPHLSGVFHCAGVLDDGVIANQSRARFENVLNPKVQGAWNLHELTSARALDHFVCFSSTSAILDGAGQSNYAAANAYLDSLIRYRRDRGLAGLAVNWGGWSGGGMAAELASRKQGISGDFIDKDDALSAMGQLMAQGRRQALFTKMRSRLSGSAAVPKMYEELRVPVEVKPGSSSRFEDLLEQHHGDAAKAVTVLLHAAVSKLLGVPASDLSEDENFIAAGIDSLALAELRNNVNRGLGKNIPLGAFLAHGTVQSLAQHIAKEHSSTGVALSKQVKDVPISRVVSLRSGGSSLFCIPGMGNNIFDFKHFSDAVKDRTVYVLHAADELPAKMEPDEISFLAGKHIAAMRATQSSGPYHLVGYSFGGILAVEIANQLLCSGQEVGSLSLIDCIPSFRYRNDAAYRHTAQLILIETTFASLNFSEQQIADFYEKCSGKDTDAIATVFREMLKMDGTAVGSLGDLFERTMRSFDRRMDADYQPPSLLGKLAINFFKADRRDRLVDVARKAINPELTRPDGAYGWELVLGNHIRIQRFDATHSGILKAPHIAQIADVIAPRTEIIVPSSPLDRNLAFESAASGL